MGYPMTFKRLVNRNGLSEGTYRFANERPSAAIQWQIQLNLTNPGLGSLDDLLKIQQAAMVKRLETYENAIHNVLGDLRRLEQDAVDENGIARYIAQRTAIDADTVAIVLKEFMSY